VISDGDRSFFRGAEFSRLLVLGALVLAGVPMAIYYGYLNRGQPPVARVAAASIPPLPPADDAPEFALVRDDKPREVRDDDAIELLIRRVRDDTPPGLAITARREVRPADLDLRPKRYRGLPIRIEGYAQQVFVVDDQDKTVVPSGRLYEVWFYQDRDDKKLPCVLYTENVPPTLPVGQGLGERIAVEGYFLKLLAFPGSVPRSDGKAKLYHAPLLIGRLVHDPSVGGGVSNGERSRSWMLIPLGALIAYVAIRLVFMVRRSLRPRATLRRTNSPIDQIDPDDLGRWLEQKATEPDEDDPAQPS